MLIIFTKVYISGWSEHKWQIVNIKVHQYQLTITYGQLMIFFIFGVLTPLSAIFQLYHGDQFQWWKKPEYPERTTDHGQATGKLYHLRLQFEYTFL